MAGDDITARCVEAYGRLKNLKLVGDEVGIPWQSVYLRLKSAGVPVVGDKARYGSEKDKLAHKAEREFERLVPFARNNNKVRYQPRVDFDIGPYGVDVKAARAHRSNARFKSKRWEFCIKKQEMCADFVVGFGYRAEGGYDLFLFPGEVIRHYSTVSVQATGRTKWRQYQIQPDELRPFFESMLKTARSA
jgi:hypothetical protein